MLMHIKPVNFFLPGDTQADGLIDRGEYKDGHHEHIGGCCCHAQKLCRKAASVAKDSGEDSTHGTADAVDADCAYRVVNLYFLVKEFYGEYDQDSGGGADDDCLPFVYHVTAGSDCYQSGKGTVEDTSGFP